MIILQFAVGLCLCAAPKFPDVDQLPIIRQLPDPFRMQDGARVKTREDWNRRREEIKDLLLYYEYGHMPPPPANLRAEIVSTEPVFDGKARLVRLILRMGPESKVHVEAGLYVPATAGKHPVLLAIEPVPPPRSQVQLPRSQVQLGNEEEKAAQKALERGYILAGYQRHDLGPDNEDRSGGVFPLYPDDDWATLAVWAWGAMRMVDYLETRDDVDFAHIALTGHSRAGKTALLAAALDDRIALVAPHGSGAGGAGSFRFCPKNAESLEMITNPKRFHYWFQPRLRDFAGQENCLPFDQHFLKALVAPRPLVSMEGAGDAWSNPRGTQLVWMATQPVYDFLGAPDRNVLYVRPGGHDMTDGDWNALLDYCDCFFFGKARPADAPLPFPPSSFPSWTWERGGEGRAPARSDK